MTVSFHKYGDLFFPGTGDVKVIYPLYSLLWFVFDYFGNIKINDVNEVNLVGSAAIDENVASVILKTLIASKSIIYWLICSGIDCEKIAS